MINLCCIRIYWAHTHRHRHTTRPTQAECLVLVLIFDARHQLPTRSVVGCVLFVIRVSESISLARVVCKREKKKQQQLHKERHRCHTILLDEVNKMRTTHVLGRSTNISFHQHEQNKTRHTNARKKKTLLNYSKYGFHTR